MCLLENLTLHIGISSRVYWTKLFCAIISVDFNLCWYHDLSSSLSSIFLGIWGKSEVLNVIKLEDSNGPLVPRGQDAKSPQCRSQSHKMNDCPIHNLSCVSTEKQAGDIISQPDCNN